MARKKKLVEVMSNEELIMWALHYILLETVNGRYVAYELAQRVGREPHGS